MVRNTLGGDSGDRRSINWLRRTSAPETLMFQAHFLFTDSDCATALSATPYPQF